MKQWYFNEKLNADSLTAKGLCSQNVHYVKEVVVFLNWLFQEVKFDYNSIKMSPSLLICTLYLHGQATILLNTNVKKNIYLPATSAGTLRKKVAVFIACHKYGYSAVSHGLCSAVVPEAVNRNWTKEKCTLQMIYRSKSVFLAGIIQS